MSWAELPELARLFICGSIGAAVMILIVVMMCQCVSLCKRRNNKGLQTDSTCDLVEKELADIAPHRHFHQQAKTKDKKTKTESLKSKTSLSSSGSEGYGSLKGMGKPHLKQRVQRSPSQGSNEMPSLDEIQFLQVPETIQEPGSLGTVELSLSYERDGEKLIINVLSAHDLSPKPSGGMPSPFVKLGLHRSNAEKAEYEFRTKIQQRTDNPNFDETFGTVLKESSLSKYTLNIVVCGYHRLGQCDILGEAELKLKEVDWNRGTEKDMVLGPSTQIPQGELLVSMCHLPTAERVCITVLRANGFNEAHDPFIKVCLVVTSKAAARRRVAATDHRPNLMFDKPVFFDVPREKLDRVKLLIVVMETTVGQDETDDDGSLEAAPTTREIGKILLGKSCSQNAHAHWEEVMRMPRIPFAQWYPIFSEHGT